MVFCTTVSPMLMTILYLFGDLRCSIMVIFPYCESAERLIVVFFTEFIFLLPPNAFTYALMIAFGEMLDGGVFISFVSEVPVTSKYCTFLSALNGSSFLA